jgi:hypothetical protein
MTGLTVLEMASRSSIGGAHGCAKPPLKTPLGRFQSTKCVEQLEPSFAHLVRSWSKLLGVFDGEADTIHGNPRLVRHFKFGRSRPRLHFGFDNLQKLAHCFSTHETLLQESLMSPGLVDILLRR